MIDSLMFVPEGPVDFKYTLVQVMAWWWTGEKPLFEQVLTKMFDVMWGHWSNVLIDLQGSMSPGASCTNMV